MPRHTRTLAPRTACRKHGITLHLLIDSERQAIPDVPAVYFVQPTEENIDRIIRDASARTYDQFFCNFASSVPRPLMEHFASAAVRHDCATRVQKARPRGDWEPAPCRAPGLGKWPRFPPPEADRWGPLQVFDQYLSFVSLEKDLFTLGLPEAYLQLNDPTQRDSHIEATVATIIDSLFSVLATSGVVPVIRCPKGGAAEHVAQLLCTRIRDHLRAKTGLFPDSAGRCYQTDLSSCPLPAPPLSPAAGVVSNPSTRSPAGAAQVPSVACTARCWCCSTATLTCRGRSSTRGYTSRSCMTCWA